MARISELHYSNAYASNSGVSEFLEVSLSPSESPEDFTVTFYQSDGSVALEVNLAESGVLVDYDAQSDENTYVISNDHFDILLTDPDGSGSNNAEAYALTDISTDTVLDFYDIGGGTTNIVADGGAADGAESTNLPVPTGPQASTYSIQFNQPDPTTPVYQAVNPGDSGVCFTPGTLIATDLGPRDVACLRAGDLIKTRDAGLLPLRWVGSRTVPAAGVLAPIMIPAGLFGLTADLTVSPQHRVLVTGWQAEMLTGQNEVLVAARHLVDADRIVRRPGGMVTYFHLLFDSHQLVCANGAWSESYHPGQTSLTTASSEVRTELLALFPDLARGRAGYGPSARTTLRAHEARLLRDPGQP